MEHLNTETLAKLVDNAPAPDEAEHLAECMVCSSELQALRLQTEQLGSLPALLPPLGDWEFLEARLRSEGLVNDPGLFRRMGLAHTPGWMRAAAAVVLFLGGAAVGAGFTTSDGDVPGLIRAPNMAFASAETVEDAATAVRVAEQNYVSALTRYSQLMESEGSDPTLVDPRSRFAALEYLLAASQAAVRQAPADPFLNGLLAATRAEREATLRQISTRQDNWF
jgi:hypothetical protein